jgi:ABC-type antimicrobial peptide transport system permease subunit
VMDEVRRIVSDRLKAVPIVDVRTLSHQMEATLVPERLVARLSSVFGTIAVLLTSLGLYSLLAYTTARRVGEIGLRMALGATTYDVLWMIVRRAVILAAAGLALGLPVAEWSRRIAASMVTNLTNGPLALLVLAGLSIFVVTAVAAYLPARRAAHVQPVQALRQQ